MKKLFCRIFLIAAFCVPVCICAMEATEAPQTSAASFILMDAASGRVLLEKDAHARREIASTTKLMTAYAALAGYAPKETVSVGKAHLKEGSSMYLADGEEVSKEALLYGLMLPSGNDAAECIADHCAPGRESFIARMNDSAKRLGMENTAYQNPSGLDEEGHYSSAFDLARLACAVMEEPELLRIVSTRQVSIGGRQMENHNKLLGALSGCIGFKTGYTSAAGRTLVSGCVRNGLCLVAVTLSDRSDWEDHASLYDYGFSQFTPTNALRRGEVVAQLPLRGGGLGSIKIAAAETLTVPLAANEEVSVELSLPEELTAPCKKGSAVGEALVAVNGEIIAKTALVCAEDAAAVAVAEESNILSRLIAVLIK